MNNLLFYIYKIKLNPNVTPSADSRCNSCSIVSLDYINFALRIILIFIEFVEAVVVV